MLSFANGDVYEGMFREDKIAGDGILNYLIVFRYF